METIRISSKNMSGETKENAQKIAPAISEDSRGKEVKKSLIARLETISYYLLIGLSFLTPFFVVPSLSVSFSKAVLMVAVTVILLILWIIRQLKSDRVVVLYHVIPFSLLGVIFIFLLSSLLTGNYYASLFGIGFEVGTGISMIAGSIIVLLASSILRTEGRVFTFIASFFVSLALLALYQVIRIIAGPEILTFGFLNAATDNLLGKWNELSLFFGLSALLSVIALESLVLNRLFKIVVWVLLVISAIFLAITNFSYVLIPVLIATSIGLAYTYVVKHKVSVPIAFVFAVSLIFLAQGNRIHSYVYTHITNRLAISQIEVAPSFTHTAGLVQGVMRRDPLFGVGPSLFTKEWLLNTPKDVNQSDYWDRPFTHSRGLIPTYAVTTGILGILVILIFLGTLIFAGLKTIFSVTINSFRHYLVVSTFFGALYLWAFQFFYVPTSALLTLTFLFTGAFLAMVRQEGLIPEKKFTYRESPRASFGWVMVLIAILIGTLSVGVVAWNKTASSLALSRAYIALNAGDVPKGEVQLKQALKYESSDTLYRIMVDVQTSKMGAILTSANDSKAIGPDGKQLTKQEIATALSGLLTDALDYASKAIKVDPNAYENWVSLGSVYEGVMPLGYEGAYENAVSAYSKAMELAPSLPSLPLIMARLEASKPDRKNYIVARQWLTKAFALKQNYTDALFFDSQLSINDGDVKKAIATVSQVAFLRPSDASVFFQLGYLKYSDKDYAGAIEALNRAIDLKPAYANARYFLGLSLSKMGNNQAALAEFEEIAKLNGDNQDVQSILSNLRAGRSALASEPAPTPASSSSKKTTTPKKLPIKGE